MRFLVGTSSNMASVFRLADVVLSIHRSEGLGLVPAQAMVEGKPVVATAWSGNMDFMTGAEICPRGLQRLRRRCGSTWRV